MGAEYEGVIVCGVIERILYGQHPLDGRSQRTAPAEWAEKRINLKGTQHTPRKEKLVVGKAVLASKV